MADEAKPGRPTKLTPAIQEALVDLIRRGVTRQAAADRVGIGYRTLAEWVARGEERHPERDPSEEFAQFAQALREAEAEFEDLMIADLRAIAVSGERPDWKGVAWLLERRFPDRWGKATKPAEGDKDAVVERPRIYLPPESDE